MPFAGFDSLTYPGDDTMQWLRTNTNFSFVGFYLAPAPARPTSDWMGKYDTLAGQGWGFAPLYVGQQELGQPGPHNLTSEQGIQDGQDAVTLMSQAGFPPNSIVYLDCEQGGPASDERLDYVGAWVDAVRMGPPSYTPGLYCSYTTAASLLAIRSDVYVWVWNITNPANGPIFPTPDPAVSGTPQATVWQYYQNNNVTFAGAPNPDLTLDLNSASIADPSKTEVSARKKHLARIRRRKKLVDKVVARKSTVRSTNKRAKKAQKPRKKRTRAKSKQR
jgi:hypothetical protein